MNRLFDQPADAWCHRVSIFSEFGAWSGLWLLSSLLELGVNVTAGRTRSQHSIREGTSGNAFP